MTFNNKRAQYRFQRFHDIFFIKGFIENEQLVMMVATDVMTTNCSQSLLINFNFFLKLNSEETISYSFKENTIILSSPGPSPSPCPNRPLSQIKVPQKRNKPLQGMAPPPNKCPLNALQCSLKPILSSLLELPLELLLQLSLELLLQLSLELYPELSLELSQNPLGLFRMLLEPLFNVLLRKVHKVKYNIWTCKCYDRMFKDWYKVRGKLR